MKSVLLFSGGLDSFCYAYLCAPNFLLYLNNKSKYSRVEIDNLIILAQKTNLSEKLRIIDTKDMGYLEQQNSIIENRNLFFILEGVYFADEIILGATAGDGSRDKDVTFFHLLEKTLTYTMNRKITIHAPYIHLTKSEIIGKYIEKGGNIDHLKQIYSCYGGDQSHCGKCKPCIRNAIAFHLNKIDTSNLYEFDIFQNKQTIIEYCRKVQYSSIGTKRNKESDEIDRFLDTL